MAMAPQHDVADAARRRSAIMLVVSSQPDAERPAEDDPQSMDHRQERIRVETSRHRIEGLMTLARDGYRSRVSDVLNASERDFLTLTDATVQPLEGGPLELHAFLVLARRQIVFAVSANAPGED
jgi:hypothetical protein